MDRGSLARSPVETYKIELNRNFPHMNATEHETLFELLSTPEQARATFNKQSDKYAFIDNSGMVGDGKHTRTAFLQASEIVTQKQCYSLEDKLIRTNHYWLASTPLRDQVLFGLKALEEFGIYPFFLTRLKYFQDVALRKMRLKFGLYFGGDINRSGNNALIKLGHLVPVFVIMGTCWTLANLVFLLEMCRKI